MSMRTKKTKLKKGEGKKMPGATVVSINSLRSRKNPTTSDGLSYCPYERKRQYEKLSEEDHQELYRMMTGKSNREDKDKE